MRIHSSSLTFTPLGLNHKTGKNNSAQNNDPSVVKETQKISQAATPDTIKNTLDNNNLSIDFTHNNLIKPTDSRILRALSAYNQAFNAPLQDQRTQLITGIDIYA